MKYSDSISYCEKNYDTLVEKFLEKNIREWGEFIEFEFQTARENGFIETDNEYEQLRDDGLIISGETK